MNKIYKVMYSKVKQCYVVVSEIVKSHGRHTKSSIAKSSAALTAGVLIALGSFSFEGMPVVQAADGTESLRNNDFVGANDQYWYYDEDAKEWKTYQYKLTSAFNNRSRGDLPNYQGGGAKLPGAITAGLYAQAGQQTVTIGDRNAGQSKGSVFIGEHSGYNNGDNAPAGMKNNYVTSVGFQSDATGWGSIAIGSNATAENSKMESQVVTEVGNANTSGTVSDDTYGIEEKPTIQGASVALGYNAHSKDGNIAIGSYSDATSTDGGDSYLSVGSETLKRCITNVAQGTGNSDVVTLGQMNDAIKNADNLNVNAGWGINVADENDPKTGAVTKKNVISLKHNLGTGYNDDEAKGMIIGGLVEDRDPAKQYGAADANSVIVGAGKALASGKSSVVVGGLDNVASGATSVVIGGDNNNAAGNQSAVFGGRDNTAGGIASTAGGGIMNVANGQQAVALGGAYNYALGVSSTAIGGTGGNGMYGYSTSVNGNYSVSLAGGSTGTGALNGLAAGNQSVVTTANGTAVGYQATTDKEGTIAFGHDAGDVSGYAVTWKQRTDGKTNADHTTNDYTQVPDSVTPTTYKDAYYNRLVKVADGIDDHDVVVMEQLNNAKNDLKVNAGWGINVNDVTTKNADDTETTTKNVISLNRNLGTNYGNPWKGEGKVTFEASGENSLILGGAASILQSNVNDNVKAGAYGKDSVLVGGFNNLIETNKIQTGEDAVIVGGDTNKVTGLRSVIIGGYQNNVSGGHSVVVGGELNETNGGGAGVFGGQSNKAAGEYSSVLGGDHNEADGDWSSAIGGTTNTASGLYATTLGGESNDAKGNESVVVGGAQNVALGKDSTVNGGAQNTSYGMSSYVAGGMNNMAFGNASVALGGIKSNVNAKVSTGIAGGSTEEKAITALAAGHQSVVTSSGVEWRKVTQEDVDAINQKLPSWSGFTYTEAEDPYTTYVLDKVSTAVGYQSTADAPGVIAFGHDKGDVASVAKKWKQKATMEVDDNYSVKYYDANHKEISSEDYYKLENADGTWNDYTQDPIGTENTTYQSAYYNRLVKAADGIDAHDAVVMEQLKPYTKSDASNIGSNLKTYTVGDDGETITEADATPEKQKKNKDDWGKALGADPFTAGTTATATDASTSDQLVTGKTLYNYDAPVAETGKKLNYVSANNTTGQNLLNLDRQVKTNTDTLSDVNSRSVKYDTKTENGKTVVDNTKITLAGEGGTTITNLKDGVKNNDAATVGQLDDRISGVTYEAGNGIDMSNKKISAVAGTGITVNAKGINVNTGKHLSVNTSGKVDVDDNGEVAADDGNLVTGKTVYDALHGGLDNITVGKDGQNGKDGSLGIAGQNGKDGYSITYIKTEQGAAGVDGKDGEDGITRVVYQDKDGNGKHTFATLDDGLKFKGDDSTIIAKKLNEQLNITGGADSTKLTDKNIGVNSSTDGLKIQLAKNLAGITSIANQTTTGKGDAQTTTGAKIDLKDDGSISVNSGKITDVKSGLTATDGTYADTDKNNAANIGDVHSMIEKEAGNTDDKLALKANVAADNIGTHITDTTVQKTNLDNWGAAIGTGAVADITNEHANQLVTGKTVYDALHGGLDNITVGKDGKDGVTMKAVDGENGTEGHIGLTGPAGTNGIKGADGQPGTSIDITVKNGYDDGAKGIDGSKGVDGKDGEDGITRIVYTDKSGEHQVATMEDGLKFKGDGTTVINKKLNNTMEIIGGAKGDLTEGNIGVNSTDKGQLKVQLAKDLKGITSISNQKTEGGKTTGAKITLGTDGSVNVNGGKIINVGSGIEKDATDNITEASKTNAANIGDVQTIAESTATSLTGKGLKFAANSGAEYTAKLGSTVKIQGAAKREGHEYTADNLTTEIDGNGNITILMDKDMSVEKLAVNGKDGKEGAPGTAGSIGISGQDGQSSVGIDGKDGISIKGRDGKDGVTMKAVDGENGTEGHIGLKGPAGTNGIKGADGQPGTSIDITVKNGYNGANGVNGKNGVDGTSLTRIVYTDGAGEHQVATMEDGLKFKGDDGTEIAQKLNNTMEIIGGADSTKLTDKNIGVNSDGDKLKVQLSKDLTGMNSTTYTTTTGEGESATTSTTVVNGNGLTITDGPSITNKGIDGGNKVITNVGSGIKPDANGKYTVTNQNKGNAANIGDVQNMINDAKTELTDGANGLNNKANIDASNIGANLKNADGSVASAEDQKANAKKWGSAIGTGEIKADDGRMVTGKTVYDEVRPTQDGNYVKKTQTTGENLSALDSKIGKLDETKTYNYIDSKASTTISDNLTKLDTQVKDNANAITNINQSISTLDQNAVKYDDSSKSKISLGGEGGTTITNVKAGVLSENSSDAVNGGQLWQVDQKVDTNTTNITKNAGDITNLKNLSNITDAGKTVIKNLSKDAVQVKAGDRIKVDETTDDKGNKTYTISANNNGTVEKDDGNLISGGTLYNEVHVDKDGTYIKSKDSATGKDMTVAQNLSALDSGLKTTSDLIHTNTAGDTIQIGGSSTATKIDVNGKDGKGRVITGVVSDANDPTSAANVGYVNGVTSANTQQIYRDMNNAYGRLNNNINKAAAGSNALAALHPLDYDPDDKADFAVGYGHYRNANAAAVGAFYHPNENTMVNVGVSLGNGDPGFNAGVSFKVGRGGAGREAMSKTEMAKVINSQSKEIDALKKDNADKDKRIDTLEQKMAEILAKLDKNGK